MRSNSEKDTQSFICKMILYLNKCFTLSHCDVFSLYVNTDKFAEKLMSTD